VSCKNKLPLLADSLSLGASLEGKVSHYSGKQNIYFQGTPANNLFVLRLSPKGRSPDGEERMSQG
jgi:hypothetical protein